jgi:hypothetical protein
LATFAHFERVLLLKLKHHVDAVVKFAIGDHRHE